MLAVIGVAIGAGPVDAQRYEYVITFDNVDVQGIDGTTETPAVAHRDPPAGAEGKPSSAALREPADASQGTSASGAGIEPFREFRTEPSAEPRRELGALHPPEPFGELKPRLPARRENGQGTGSQRPEGGPPRAVVSSFGPHTSFPPGRGSLNPSFVQEGFLVEAFWAVKMGASDAYFKRAHFHPLDLSTGFEAQHLGHPKELHGIFIRSVDGKRFGLKSLRYRVTRNRELPNKAISIEGFNNFNVNVLVGREFDPRAPIRSQFVLFPVGLPVGNELGLPWWALRIFGFELVSQVYIASSGSVDFDQIVLTRSEPPPAALEQPEDKK